MILKKKTFINGCMVISNLVILSSALQKGQEWIVEWWPQEGPLSNPQNEVDNPKKRHRKLLRCSGCKQALYCSQNCQKMDWNVS